MRFTLREFRKLVARVLRESQLPYRWDNPSKDGKHPRPPTNTKLSYREVQTHFPELSTAVNDYNTKNFSVKLGTRKSMGPDPKHWEYTFYRGSTDYAESALDYVEIDPWVNMQTKGPVYSYDFGTGTVRSGKGPSSSATNTKPTNTKRFRDVLKRAIGALDAYDTDPNNSIPYSYYSELDEYRITIDSDDWVLPGEDMYEILAGLLTKEFKNEAAIDFTSGSAIVLQDGTAIYLSVSVSGSATITVS